MRHALPVAALLAAAAAASGSEINAYYNVSEAGAGAKGPATVYLKMWADRYYNGKVLGDQGGWHEPNVCYTFWPHDDDRLSSFEIEFGSCTFYDWKGCEPPNVKPLFYTLPKEGLLRVWYVGRKGNDRASSFRCQAS